MALRSAVHVQVSQPSSDTASRSEGPALGLLWAGFLTGIVAAPWLLPGFLFGTDWPGQRHFVMPHELDSSALLQVALTAIGRILGGEATGKLLVLGSLFAAGCFAYRALPEGGFLPRAAAATIYVINPFVYGRLHYGQLFLLAAYATLPLAAASLHWLLVQPGLPSSLAVACVFALIGIFSPHILLEVALVGVTLAVAHVVWRSGRAAYLVRLVPWIVASVLAALVVSSYWVVPLLTGSGYGGAVLASTSPGDLSAFAAVPDRTLGLVPNLIGLYGFWAENTGRFTSMKAFLPQWPAVLSAILAVGAIGGVAAFRRRDSALSPWVAGLVAAAVIGLILEMGVSQPFSGQFVLWLDAHFSIYRGMRDAGKWAALIALVYSQLFGFGVAVFLSWVRDRVKGFASQDWAAGAASAILLVLPLIYGNGLLFGAHGEIKPSQYPAGWYAADRVLASDPSPGRTLFLPWHEYMRYSFVQNQNAVIASPAPTFFSVPILVSADPEVPGIAPPVTPDQTAVSNLVRGGDKASWAEVLAARGVKYVLLAHELDWGTYQYLDDQPGLIKVGDYGSVSLYRNNLAS